jgi:hypothetical protein
MKGVTIAGGIITIIGIAGIIFGLFGGRDQYIAITGAIIVAAGCISSAIMSSKQH